MPTFTIEYDCQRDAAINAIAKGELPMVVRVDAGEKHVRSASQNRLMHMWFREIEKSEIGMDAIDARAWCKLHIGIPLLRAENEKFRTMYDEVLKGLSYPKKLALMADPLDLPVTRVMTPKQMTHFLDEVFKHFSEQGVALSLPDDALITQPSRKGTKWQK